MVRNYQKKVIRKFNEKQLEEAVRQFVNGEKSLRQIEREFGIPRNTISRWAKEEQPHRFGAGRTTKLSHETESILVVAIKYLGELGWPMDLQQIKSIIESYLIKSNQISIFPNNIPGEDWVQGFRKRWSRELRLRKPEYVTAVRVKGLTTNILDSFIGMLETLVNDLGIKDNPERFYNLDETGLSLEPKKSKAFYQKG